MTSVDPPRVGLASPNDAGRSCPYCRFPIKHGQQIAVCGVCGAPCHKECWEENSGCAVVACAAGPRERTAAVGLAAAGTGAISGEHRPTGTAGESRELARRSRRGWIAATATLIVMGSGGIAAALILDRRSPNSGATVTPPAISTRTVETSTTVETPPVVARKPVAPTAPAQKSNAAVSSTGRYIVSSCGAITDRATRIEWYVGPDQETTWQQATSWVANLAACGGGWKMPTAAQLEGLFSPNSSAGTGYYTRGHYFPARIDSVFSGIGGGSWVWTGTPISATEAAAVNLYEDLQVTLQAQQTIYSVRAFGVRGAS